MIKEQEKDSGKDTETKSDKKETEKKDPEKKAADKTSKKGDDKSEKKSSKSEKASEEKSEKKSSDKSEKKPEKKPAKKPQAKKSAKPIDPAVLEAKLLEAQNRAILDSAARVANKIEARYVFLIIEDIADCRVPDTVTKKVDFILLTEDRNVDDQSKKQFKEIFNMPRLRLTRMGKIKMAVMRSLSARMLAVGDKIVCITGSRGLARLDSLVVLDIGKEYELLSSTEIADMTVQVRSEIFEELITIATELANQGREGKPIGAIFVLGDTDTVMQLSRQMIFNPFQGYPEEERNILDPKLRETIREFASIDGAFIVRDDGVVMSAGRHLNAVLEDDSLPQGLGARHAAAAGITNVTAATAIAISESTGTVRIFRNGKMFMEIEKAATPGKK